MQVRVNGESCETEAVFVTDLVHERGADPTRVAVVMNGSVVPAVAHASTRLKEGDSVDLLVFVGGG